MIQATTEVKKTTTLVLDERAAAWLTRLVQNQPCETTQDTEHPDDQEIREAFWNALNPTRQL